jgi:hypothetical protein
VEAKQTRAKIKEQEKISLEENRSFLNQSPLLVMELSPQMEVETIQSSKLLAAI